MYGKNGTSRREIAIKKELEILKKQEAWLEREANSNKRLNLGEYLEERIPEKVRITLEGAFCKAFAFIFEKGTSIIEKGIDRESIEKDYQIQNYAVTIRGMRKDLRQITKTVRKADLGNIVITTVEGVGLGVLGIGLPDIIVFIGMLLKGSYEIALHYGRDYHVLEEQVLILKMLETAVSKGDDWKKLNDEVNNYIENEDALLVAQVDVKTQLDQTAKAFAANMLLLKFVQGIPVIGVLGGMGNPIYYYKIIKYVRIKYQKRYLQMIDGDLASFCMM